MELILAEWLGADGSFVSLSDDRILEFNVESLFYEIDAEKLRKYCKSKSAKKDINKIIKGAIPFGKIFPDNEIIDGDIDSVSNAIKEKLKERLKDKITSIFDLSSEKIVTKITEINDRHKNGDANKNPICEIKKIGEQYFIWTYQYAAEFEIPLYNAKKAEEPLKIRIEPRNMITEKHYHKMLESVFNFQVMDSISGQKSSHFILLYLMAFLGRVEQTLQRGVYREYVDREENLHYLKERLLIADHLRENRFAPDRVYCAFSELSGDNIINQTINQTLNRVKKAYSDSALQTRIRKIQNRLTPDELSDVPVSLNQIKSLHYNRANKPYEEIMGYCYNILQNIGGSFGSADNLKYSAFYVDMNELFETYIGNLLSKKDSLVADIWKAVCGNENTDAENINWDAYYVEPQNRGRYYLAEDGGAFNQEIRPDFLIKKKEDDSVVAVLDTKYKRLFDRRDLHYGIHREDIYQVITYGYRFNTDKIFLIYPKSPNYSQDNLISITIPSKEGDSKKLYIAYVNLLEDKTK